MIEAVTAYGAGQPLIQFCILRWNHLRAGGEVFFDPFFRLVEACRNDEARDTIVGFDLLSRLLYVMHVEIEGDAIRIISARKATNEERKHYDS